MYLVIEHFVNNQSLIDRVHLYSVLCHLVDTLCPCRLDFYVHYDSHDEICLFCFLFPEVADMPLNSSQFTPATLGSLPVVIHVPNSSNKTRGKNKPVLVNISLQHKTHSYLFIITLKGNQPTFFNPTKYFIQSC